MSSPRECQLAVCVALSHSQNFEINLATNWAGEEFSPSLICPAHVVVNFSNRSSLDESSTGSESPLFGGKDSNLTEICEAR